MARRTGITMMMAAAVLCAGAAFAKPVSDEAVKAASESLNAKISELRAEKNLTQETAREAADASLEGIEINSLTVDQFDTLERAFSWGTKGPQAVERLQTLAKEPGVDGARAAVKALVFMSEETSAEEQVAAIRTATTHPGLREAFKAGKAYEIFMQVGYAKKDAIAQTTKELSGLAKLMEDGMPPELVTNGQYLLGGMLEAGEESVKAAQAIRARLVTLGEKALQTADGKTAERLTRTLTFLNGAFAKGTLVGNVSPELTIEWSSDPAIKSLADLRGKVVVLDFWATWCGPCIRSFPQVRDLVSHYEGYPVAVIGVTSLQGKHYPKGGSPIDCTDDPAKEHSLMSGLMADHEMTWPVVFTKQDVFNPDYGVSGIPHVAILDPNGVVRYRGLHPSGDAEQKHAKIDGLLREFNLPTPSGR